MQIDTEDRRLTPRERRIVREIARNLDARKSGKNPPEPGMKRARRTPRESDE